MCIARGCRTVYPKIAPEKVEGKLPTEQSFHKFPMKKSELCITKMESCSVLNRPVFDNELGRGCNLPTSLQR